MGALKKCCLLGAVAFLTFVSCGKDEKKGDYPVWKPEEVDYVTLQKRSSKRGVSFNLGDSPANDIPLLGTGCSWSYN